MTTTELQIDEELIDVGSGNETEVAGPGRADRSVPSDPASSAEHAYDGCGDRRHPLSMRWLSVGGALVARWTTDRHPTR